MGSYRRRHDLGNAICASRHHFVQVSQPGAKVWPDHADHEATLLHDAFVVRFASVLSCAECYCTQHVMPNLQTSTTPGFGCLLEVLASGKLVEETGEEGQLKSAVGANRDPAGSRVWRNLSIRSSSLLLPLAAQSTKCHSNIAEALRLGSRVVVSYLQGL